ncbi:MAG: hypothetical protein Hens3KO_20240 [Henriciella sp.]
MNIQLAGTSLVVTALCVSTAVAIPAGLLQFQREKHIFRQQKALEKLASTDTLTGALNRRAFCDAVSDEQRRMDRSSTRGAILLFDVDWFKAVNDRYGHAAGDVVLKRIASRAQKELRRPSDHFARWGGEEFAIFLSDVSFDLALRVAERLKSELSQLRFEFEGEFVSITASFGVTALSDATLLEDALRNADGALYDAKLAGRNQVIAAAQCESQVAA